jgi:hypothetical protein
MSYYFRSLVHFARPCNGYYSVDGLQVLFVVTLYVTHMLTIAWTIPAAEIANRRHPHDDGKFSMYPSTAEDFHDGVHCKPHAVEANEVSSV